jgi:hypothetical protein
LQQHYGSGRFSHVRRRPRTEVVFVMLAKARWHEPSEVLGFCFCRRTWCHHIVLDFAAAHPNAIGPAGGQVRGVGAGMLYSLVKFSEGIGARLVWGEATENSASFYRKVLALRDVSDHFFIQGETFRYCLRQYELVVERA